MGVNRRTVLKGSALAGAAVGVPLAANAATSAVTGKSATLVIFDSRIAESADFAARRAAAHRIDLAEAQQTRWAALRGSLPPVGSVEGLTGWSDWITVRGELESRGLRVVSESPVKAALSGKTHVFRWSLKAR
jgi:hypothetical protein